jgi:hypothetical protein
MFISQGTRRILKLKGEEDDDDYLNLSRTRMAAVSASSIEQRIGVITNTLSEAIADMFMELEYADSRTLIRFFLKRTPCNCLDEVYKNQEGEDCPLPNNGIVERSKMFTCSRCREYTTGRKIVRRGSSATA